MRRNAHVAVVASEVELGGATEIFLNFTRNNHTKLRIDKRESKNVWRPLKKFTLLCSEKSVGFSFVDVGWKCSAGMVSLKRTSPPFGRDVVCVEPPRRRGSSLVDSKMAWFRIESSVVKGRLEARGSKFGFNSGGEHASSSESSAQSFWPSQTHTAGMQTRLVAHENSDSGQWVSCVQSSIGKVGIRSAFFSILTWWFRVACTRSLVSSVARSVSGRGFVVLRQPSSSELSWQSFSPSQTQFFGMHTLLALHWKLYSGQRRSWIHNVGLETLKAEKDIPSKNKPAVESGSRRYHARGWCGRRLFRQTHPCSHFRHCRPRTRECRSDWFCIGKRNGDSAVPEW